MSSESCLKILVEDSDTVIIAFGGHANALMFFDTPRFEFVNFLNKNFDNVNRFFFADLHSNTYHNGIEGISTSVDETVVYIQNEIKNFKNVICLGCSGGGYAAILFGSLLNANSVVALIPQTIRYNRNIDEKYRDISKYINYTTNYYLYGDLSITNVKDYHHIYHCERIGHHPNVFIERKKPFHLKQIRDNGELYERIQKLL